MLFHRISDYFEWSKYQKHRFRKFVEGGKLHKQVVPQPTWEAPPPSS